MKLFSTFKHFFCIFFVLILTVGLIGCKKDKPGTDTAPTDAVTAEPTQDVGSTDNGSVTDSPLHGLGGSDSSYPVDASGEVLINDVDFSNYSELTSADNSRVFYHIFVGSFSDSNNDGTGDLRGIINRMDYLNDGDPKSGKSLGVEGIWLSPIFKSPSYHKYDTTDYYTVDPVFGTMDDLKELADLCEQRGIKLILDLVINHSGSQNQWFTDFKNAHKNGDTSSLYYDFYSWNDKGSAGGRSFQRIAGSDHFYECNFSGDMPEMNFDNEFVYSTMLDVARYYLEEIGIDGFRFDAAQYIYYGDNARSGEFWVRYMKDLRAIKPDLFTVAEVWDSDMTVMNYEPALDCFNFSMSQAEGMIASTTKKGDVNTYTSYIEYYIDSIREKRPTASLVSFISNHDMDRAAGYLTYASGYAKMAASLLILNPGSSFIYYGDEIAMKGSRGSTNTDANRRLAMLWGDGDTVKDPVGSSYGKANQTESTVANSLGDPDSLYNYYKELIMIRKANPEIVHGEYKSVSIDGKKAGGFVSTLDGKSVLVLHNPGINSCTVDLSTVAGGEFGTLVASIGLEDVTLEGTTLKMGGKTSAVLR